jgi:hypothetical protein
MWIVLRLVALVLAFAARQFSWARKREDNNVFQDIPYGEHTSTHKGKVTRFEFSVPLETGLVFVMTTEGAGDRFFKGLGLTEEFQTGDETFDHRVYVGSDHPVLLRVLQGSSEFRTTVSDFLAQGFQRIWSDGHRLFVVSKEIQSAGVWIPRLARLKKAIEASAKTAGGRLSDPFAARVLLVEGVIWSLAAYAVVAFVPMFDEVGSHLDTYRVISYGLGLSLATFGALLGGVVLVLQRSSRSHRVLVESGVLLAVSLPIIGVQTVVDINRRLDRAPVLSMEASVQEKWTRVTRRRKGGTRTHYHARIHSRGEVVLPPDLEVPSRIYYSLSPGANVGVEIGQGRLGLRYFRSVNGLAWCGSGPLSGC